MIYSAHTISAVAHLPGGPLPLNMKDGSVTLDVDRMPYVQATISCPLPAQAYLDEIVPSSPVRVTLVVEQRFEDWNSFGQRAPETRTFDLALVDREVDHSNGSMTLTLWSDEADLLTWTLLTGAPERSYGLSVKNAVNLALSKIGAALQPGAADANLVADTPEPTLTNLVINPSFESATLTGWNQIGTTVARSTAQKRSGTYSYSLVRPGPAGDDFASYTVNGLTVGTKYWVSAYVWRTSVGGTSANRGMTANDSTAGSNFVNAPYAAVTGQWVRQSLSLTVNAGSYIEVRFYSQTGGTIYIDDFQVVAAANLPDFFSGATPDTGFYDYAWTGTANASASTKTNLPNTKATIWEPGTTAWEYIEPLLQATNLRLYADENAHWILEESNLAKDGLVIISEAQNVTQAQESMSRVAMEDGQPVHFTGVHITYKWRDAADVEQVAYDFAGSGISYRIQYDRPYPGPGAAQHILTRAEGRGRVFALEAMSSYKATPGQSLAATLPDTTTQTGFVSAVTWRFPDARMTVNSRALADTASHAWLLQPSGSWTSGAAGQTWATAP